MPGGQEVLVAGAGPVGLFVALELHRRGMRPRVIERLTETHGGSRSIGIHPPSLEALDRHGLARRFIAEGVVVREGRAYAGAEPIAAIRFGRCPGPFPFVLALPQHRTEALLREALEQRCPGAIHRGIEVTGVRESRDSVVVDTTAGSLRSGWLMACDGRNSRVRASLGISFAAQPYAGIYAMSDHLDDTQLGATAAVFLSHRGLVESFPLPGRRRRWVARAPQAEPVSQAGSRAEITSDDLAQWVLDRTGHRLRGRRAPSVFRAERGFAHRLATRRVAFVGDAAHVVSPIGGQGMNLGWLGAVSVVAALDRAMAGDGSNRLAENGRVRARMARAAARRAEANMWLGRPTGSAASYTARNLLLRVLAGPPLGHALARMFTMRGLMYGV